MTELRRRNIEGERGRRFYALYPDEGPLRRELYPKHMEFFAAGHEHQERAMLGGNRSGKSMGVGYEVTCHLTGIYPHWWTGYRFNRPITAWIAGEDVKSLRDSLQLTFFGPPHDLGTGLIPRETLVGKPTSRTGTAEAYDTFSVRHVSGGISRGTIKTYDQGREAFQAAHIDVVMLDEEPPMPIYVECLMRTMATELGETNGLLMCAFTPLKGLSEVVLSYLPYLDQVPGQTNGE